MPSGLNAEVCAILHCTHSDRGRGGQVTEHTLKYPFVSPDLRPILCAHGHQFPPPAASLSICLCTYLLVRLISSISSVELDLERSG